MGPAWTATPPTAPGWYWCQHRGVAVPLCGTQPRPALVKRRPYDGRLICNTGWYENWPLDEVNPEDIEWWPVPIPEPPA